MRSKGTEETHSDEIRRTVQRKVSSDPTERSNFFNKNGGTVQNTQYSDPIVRSNQKDPKD